VGSNPEFRYAGCELETFAGARRWKAYLAAQIRPFLGDDVLEVGAGLGATTELLITPRQRRWVALEPDPTLAATAALRGLGASCEVRTGTVASLAEGDSFDSILYVDVLEHIEDDAGELRQAANHLRTRGHLIVLAPAHQWLFSPFDTAIGHHRRYDRHSLGQAGPGDLVLARLRYLDAVGLAASAANRLLLRQTLPSEAQVRFWDRVMVPISRMVDPIAGFRLGKSVLAVWRNP
jgi:2-polyprenyl-3-methyl-5-hydroxy-6-metoxy-1,4-benzoquinol methylase